jgi:hypothetical protein
VKPLRRKSSEFLVCVICGDHRNVELHHIGGRRHIAWLLAPLCRRHHRQCHLLIEASGVDLEHTEDPIERLIRAMKAISIFLCMLQDALHETHSSKR